MLNGKAPSLKDIVVFGSPCMARRESRKTFNPRATQVFILGKSEETKGYVVYLIKDQKVTTTQHVKNIETLSQAQNTSLLLEAGVQDGTATGIEGQDSGPSGTQIARSLAEDERAAEVPSRAVTRAKDKRKPSQRVGDIDQANHVSVDPSTYDAAMKAEQAKEWQVAVDDELDALRQNGTWIAVPRPPHAKILHSKWVFKTKLDGNGEVNATRPVWWRAGTIRVLLRDVRTSHGHGDRTFYPRNGIHLASAGEAWGYFQCPRERGGRGHLHVHAQGHEARG
jgi:hypothetical protein